MEPEDLIDLPAALAALPGMRRHPLDGALLLFHPRTGFTAICDGDETRHLRRKVPRVVQFAITNACNLRCAFCSRDVSEASTWTVETAAALLGELSRAGVLEVAFGGRHRVALWSVPGSARVAVMKVVRDLVGCPLDVARKLVDEVPCELLEHVAEPVAEDAARQLRAAGADAEAFLPRQDP